MRVFLAIVPPQEVIEHLTEFLEPRHDPRADRGGGDWRWTRPEQTHLTLAFAPDLPERLEEDLIEAGESWVARQSRPRLVLAGAGAFPDPARAKVVWMGVAEESGRPQLGRWAHGIRGWAAHAGARLEGQAFRPHVTVARARPHAGAPAARLVQALDGYRSPAWPVESLALIGSHLGAGPGGRPRHETLHKWCIPPAPAEVTK